MTVPVAAVYRKTTCTSLSSIELSNQDSVPKTIDGFIVLISSKKMSTLSLMLQQLTIRRVYCFLHLVVILIYWLVYLGPALAHEPRHPVPTDLLRYHPRGMLGHGLSTYHKSKTLLSGVCASPWHTTKDVSTSLLLSQKSSDML